MYVCVIGAGPAGMTAAIAAAENGHKVVLIEKNEKIGKKLYITGKGRCNYTNCSSFDNYMNNIVSNPKFLYSALKKFDSEASMRFIEEGGVKLKIERGNRVFPESDKSSDIIKAFNRLLNTNGVEVHLQETVTKLVVNDGFVISIITDKAKYSPDAVILATGGVSYPATGSTGDGYKFAATLGHKIINPVPALTGINLKSVFTASGKQPFGAVLQGLSLKNVTAEILSKDGKRLFSEFGEMLFTDKGVSGPIILTLSSKINRLECQNLIIKLDLKPALSEEVLDDRLLRDFAESKNKALKNALNGLLPASMIPFVITVSGIDGDKKVNSLTKEERARLLNALKNMRFEIVSLDDIERAIVTSGGIAVNEVEPNTMRSKLVKNLYFAGEILDIDALTGGYNIQIAVSTGHLAGSGLK